ncbi:MAG: PAS domain-containing sensor histidine kinase [bacterium]
MEEKYTMEGLETCFARFNASIGDLQKAYNKIQQHLHHSGDSLSQETLLYMSQNLAHGIRNPLGGIGNLLTLLSHDYDLQQTDKVQRMHEGIERIERIIAKLIEFSSPVGTKKRRHELQELVDAVVHSVKQSLDSNRSAIQLSLRMCKRALLLEADVPKLTQALQHIVQNAFEAMPHGGKISIWLRESKTPNCAELLISDEGPGIKVDEIERCFAPFYTTKVNGMGLGLPFARKVFEKHGGTMLLENRKPTGLKVRIKLPTKN